MIFRKALLKENNKLTFLKNADKTRTNIEVLTVYHAALLMCCYSYYYYFRPLLVKSTRPNLVSFTFKHNYERQLHFTSFCL